MTRVALQVMTMAAMASIGNTDVGTMNKEFTRETTEKEIARAGTSINAIVIST